MLTKKQIAFNTIFSFTFLLIFSSFSAEGQDKKVLDILSEELDREYEVLSKAKIPAYYIEYRLNDIEYTLLNASFGSLTQNNKDRNRILTASVRVGDYSFDNNHGNGNNNFGGSFFSQPVNLPIENGSTAIKQALWRVTDQEYKRAKEKFKKIKDDQEETDAGNTADFSKAPPIKYENEKVYQPTPDFNQSIWKDRIKKHSALFQEYNDIISGNVGLSFSIERKFLTSTEGSKLALYQTSAYLRVDASIMGEEGDIIPLYRTYFASHPKDLPDTETINNDITELIQKLKTLKTAPLAEPYTGPAILLARSSGVFFHEIFGHRIEGHRLKQESDGQTFKERLDKPVLPKNINIYFDPTLTSFKGQDLNGAYKYDDQGVEARRVDIVKNGVLKSFLMSRTPLEGIPNSNGHGRAAAGFKPVSRQSNLMVESSKTHSMVAMRKMLIKECKRQNKEYGYLFSDVTGGFTNTDRYNPNAFNVMPTEVYRIYVDGRPDEMVRGVNLIGTPLAMFAEIKAMGDDHEIFTGFCGAESGSVPVSAIAPSIFVRRIETQKKPNIKAKPAILERPHAVNK